MMNIKNLGLHQKLGRARIRVPESLRSVPRFSGFCCKNSLTIQAVVTTTSSSLLRNVAKIFFATESLSFNSYSEKEWKHVADFFWQWIFLRHSEEISVDPLTSTVCGLAEKYEDAWFWCKNSLTIQDIVEKKSSKPL